MLVKPEMNNILNIFTVRDYNHTGSYMSVVNINLIKSITLNARTGRYIVKLEDCFIEMSEEATEKLFEFIRKRQEVITDKPKKAHRFFIYDGRNGKNIIALNQVIAMNKNIKGSGYYVHLSSATGVQLDDDAGEALYNIISFNQKDSSEEEE